MTAIRYSLLADQRDDADYIKRCILVGVLCFLVSMAAHLLFFTVWQLLDSDPGNSFHFTLTGENVPIELVLTFGEVTDDGQAPESLPSQTAADPSLSSSTAGEGGLFSPQGEWSDSSWGGNIFEALNNLPPDEGYDDGSYDDPLSVASPGIQNAIPQSMVDQALAQTELVPAADDGQLDTINPDPPISLEHQAPPFKSYFTTVSRAVNSRWIMPPAAKNQFRPGRLTVLFTIRKDGEMLRLVVQESSGNATLDHAGLEALRSAAPFPSFPPELSHRDQLDIIMHFDYKATYKRPDRD